jgi:hypothetical protein
MSLGRKTEELNFPDEPTNRRGSILVWRSVDGAAPKDNSAYFRRRREQSTECRFEQPLQYALTLHYQVQVVAHGLLLIRPGQNSNDALFRSKLFPLDHPGSNNEQSLKALPRSSRLLEYPGHLFHQFAGVEGIGKYGKRPDHGAYRRKKSGQKQHQANQVTQRDAAHHRLG